jgi:hypothetical protein
MIKHRDFLYRKEIDVGEYRLEWFYTDLIETIIKRSLKLRNFFIIEKVIQFIYLFKFDQNIPRDICIKFGVADG